MDHSIIYLKEKTKFKYVDYNCCEYLGDNSNKAGGKFFIGLPIRELSEFFKNLDNLKAYSEFISSIFDVEYRMAKEEEIVDIENEDTSVEKIFIFVNTNKHSNKRFVASYTLFRYIWYHQWENMAIIATNLYRLKIFESLTDILAIACSYQEAAGRSLLPVDTLVLPGLLYFRSANEIMKELDKNELFNNVFYKYPIYFDPKVVIKGSFFNTYETVVPSKSFITGLQGILSPEEMSSMTINTLNKIKDDYLETKEVYLKIFEVLNKEYKGFLMDKSTPLLLSVENIKIGEFGLYGVHPTGLKSTIKVKI